MASRLLYRFLVNRLDIWSRSIREALDWERARVKVLHRHNILVKLGRSLSRFHMYSLVQGRNRSRLCLKA
jgi:hypothetical protein